jgi:hypothetical protein
MNLCTFYHFSCSESLCPPKKCRSPEGTTERPRAAVPQRLPLSGKTLFVLRIVTGNEFEDQIIRSTVINETCGAGLRRHHR